MTEPSKGWTAGAWEQDGLVIRCSRGIIARCPVPQAGGVFDVQTNAKLISKAPELAEALRALVKTCGLRFFPASGITMCGGCKRDVGAHGHAKQCVVASAERLLEEVWG